jgi:hypothetical protein
MVPPGKKELTTESQRAQREETQRKTELKYPLLAVFAFPPCPL